MRVLILALLLISLSFAKVLSLKDAFKYELSSDMNGVYIEFLLAKDINLYKDELHIFLKNTEITKLLNMPKTELFQGKESFKNKLFLYIPNMLIKDSLKADKGVLRIDFQGCSEQGFCYLPTKLYYNISLDGKSYKLSKVKAPLKPSLEKGQEAKIYENLKNKSFWLNIASFFVYGLLLSLTPCILPMIPILSGLLANKIENGKKYAFFLAFIYVFFMSLAYAFIGVLASFLGFNIQGALQTPALLIGFSLIFVLLALSMFGLFDLSLPSSLQKWLDSKSQKGGLAGVATMGFLSALIVGPCIAPPLAGALLYITQTKDVIFGGLALFVMSFGMGVPLLFIGFGFKFLRPGPWMEKIKFIFGFLMLAMAIWILERILSLDITLLLYGILGVFFATFMGLFEPDLGSVLAKLKRGFLIIILALSLIFFSAAVLNFFNLAPKNISYTSELRQKISSLKELREIVAKNKEPTLVYYTASWCATCKLLKPFFKRADLSEFKVYEVDLSDNSALDIELMKAFNIFGPPALLVFEDNELEEQISGYDEIKEFLEDYID